VYRLFIWLAPHSYWICIQVVKEICKESALILHLWGMHNTCTFIDLICTLQVYWCWSGKRSLYSFCNMNIAICSGKCYLYFGTHCSQNVNVGVAWVCWWKLSVACLLVLFALFCWCVADWLEKEVLCILSECVSTCTVVFTHNLYSQHCVMNQSSKSLDGIG